MKFIQNLNYNDVEQCLDYLKNNKFNFHTSEHIIFHVFWSGKLNRRQLLCIKSYIYSQNLSNTSLYVWIESDLSFNKKIIPNHPNIIIKEYNSLQESKNTPFENQPFIDYKLNLKFRSDIARMMILHNYGGIYYDLDLILFKDLNCLLNFII